MLGQAVGSLNLFRFGIPKYAQPVISISRGILLRVARKGGVQHQDLTLEDNRLLVVTDAFAPCVLSGGTKEV